MPDIKANITSAHFFMRISLRRKTRKKQAERDFSQKRRSKESNNAVRRIPQKVGSEPKALCVRLQTHSRRERDLLRKRRGKEAGGCFSAKKNGAKRTLLRRGGDDGI